MYSFRPRLVPTLAAAALVALTVSLGRWQVNRAEEKTARSALLEARQGETPLRLTGSITSAEPLLYRRVTATGEWIASGQVFVDNQSHAGRAGFHVITPLAVAPDAVVLVNRGWVARGAEYPAAPRIEVPAGRVDVAGLVSLPPARFLELSAQGVTGNVFQNLSIERYREALRLPVLPFVVLADVPAPGLQAVREGPRVMGAQKHREYALTWFSLAATALVLWIFMNLERRR